MVLVHFKTDATKARQEVPLAPSMVKLVALLERAAHAHSPATNTLYCTTLGKVYEKDYFYSIGGKVLSFARHCLTSRDLRHSFVTAWRDFSSSPLAKLHGITVAELEVAASSMMLNSPQAWDEAYDDSILDREALNMMAQWDKFTEFVREAHLDKASEK